MSPRPRPPPILKSSLAVSSSNPFAFSPKIRSPHVHFPPTPTISSTHITHAATIYDRTPLEIAPNVCALPGRGERSYNSCDLSSPAEVQPTDLIKGSYFHPQAYEACEREKLEYPSSPPPLVYGSQSCSSESDESDGALATPPDPYSIPPPQIAVPGNDMLSMSHSPITRKCSQEELDNALTFLPHPPTISLKEKGRTKRSKSPGHPKQKSSDRRRTERDFIPCSSFTAPSLDGCLGGF